MTPFRISRFLLLAIAVVIAGTATQVASAQPANPKAGTFDESLSIGGRDRTYRVHVPDLDAPAAGFPVLIVLHGGGGNGTFVERSTGFTQLADQKGFIAVYPDGTGRFGNKLTWNAHNCCAYAHEQDVDDVGFISAMIDRVIADYDVDPARIYITGHSNGAMMTFRIACELSGKIAAAAPYAGALNTGNCPATEPVAMLIMNGEDDGNVPVAGGTSVDVGVPSQDDRVDQPTSHAVDTWVTLDGCDPTPNVTDSAAAVISTYQNCASNGVVEQVLIHGWKHNWPNPAKGSPIDASAFIWDFVSQFEKPAA